MATPTTSFDTIRDKQVSLIRSLVPASLASTGFRLAPEGQDFDEFIEAKPNAALRRFEVRDTSEDETPEIWALDVRQIPGSTLIRIAYPASAALGRSGYLSQEKAARQDMQTIVDAIEDPRNYVAGQSSAHCRASYVKSASVSVAEIEVAFRYRRASPGTQLIRYPDNVADWIRSYSAPFGDVVLTMQDEAGALQATDASANGLHFTPSDVTFAVEGENGRRAVRFNSGPSALTAPAGFGMAPLDPFSVWGRFFVPADVSVKVLFGQLGADPRWYAVANYNTEQLGMLIDDGPTVRSSSFGYFPDHFGTWMDVITVYDPLLERFTAATNWGRTAFSFGNVVKEDLIISQPFHVGSGEPGGGSGHAPSGALCSYLVAWRKHALTEAQQDQILNFPIS